MALPFVPLTEEYAQGERDFRKFYLEDADLHQAVLPEIILEEADLRCANLSQADLSRAKLCGADLTGANLSGAILVGADLSNANLANANLTGADLSGAVLDKAFLRQADFRNANLSSASLVEVDGRGWVRRVDGKGTIVQRTSFEGAVLRDADLTDAYLRLCDFRAADLTNAKLVSADLSSVDATPIPVPNEQPKVTILLGADLSRACLRKARFSFCDFREANLVGADLRQAVLGGSFKDADLTQVLFYDTVVDKCDLTGAVLTGTHLKSVKFGKVRMPDGNAFDPSYEKFIGPPPNPSGKTRLSKAVEYTEFWFETYEELHALSWPTLCVCCGEEFDRYERYSRESVEDGTLLVYEVRVPYCTACLQHSVRFNHPREWMKMSCTAMGGSSPAVKFEIRTRGILSSKEYFVISFTNPEYVIGFSSGNGLPAKGFKGTW